MEERKLNRIKVVLAEKDKTGPFFVGLEQDDYNSVLSGIEMNYK